MANTPPQVALNVSENEGGNTQNNAEDPAKDHNYGRLAESALVLGPNWKHDRDATVDADDDQQEDAAEHVEEHNRGGELA